MSIKSILISLLVTGLLANTAVAAGSHAHDHNSQMQGKMQNSHHGNMQAESEHMNHGDDKHPHQGSPVGQPALAALATKTIRVTTMDTMRFEFSSALNIKDGDIIKFIVTNVGNTPHEFSIGDAEEQKSHRKMMQEMPNMTHQDGNTITVNPGESKELTWQFKAGNEVVFACNIPGHFEAGMFAKAEVGTAPKQHY